jgi:DNA-binding winged helix-turn-helix (wHTH) protein
MRQKITESSYPDAFRVEDAASLGKLICEHNSVSLIGMKRVGISNFLRFFLYHPTINETYIKNGMRHVFIPIDLNDLIKRDLYPFWVLVLTRLVDTIKTINVTPELTQSSEKLFSTSIQLKDQFFTMESIRKIVSQMNAEGIYPTLFLIRFDRLTSAVNPEFYNNLQGIRDAAFQQLSFVFTSYRPLYQLNAKVFAKTNLSVFSQDLYIKPAKQADLETILTTFENRYGIKLSDSITNWLTKLSGGHVQYLQLSLIKLREEKQKPTSYEDLLSLLLTDEEIRLQSEELFESLTKSEQEVLLRISQGVKVPNLSEVAPYLLDTGLVCNQTIFSPLLCRYLQDQLSNRALSIDFTNKENRLFSILNSRMGNLCEREEIIEAVWPEMVELGVSDWAVDRLVARVRHKLKLQKSPFEIVTVITRGYKLMPTAAENQLAQ